MAKQLWLFDPSCVRFVANDNLMVSVYISSDAVAFPWAEIEHFLLHNPIATELKIPGDSKVFI